MDPAKDGEAVNVGERGENWIKVQEEGRNGKGEGSGRAGEDDVSAGSSGDRIGTDVTYTRSFLSATGHWSRQL